MSKKVISALGRALAFLLVMTVLCGGIYPLAVTGVAQATFPYQANGSIFTGKDGKQYSALLGQQFTGEGHLWGRILTPDTGTFADDEGNPVMYAWASNKSPAGEEYEELVAARVEAIRAAHPDQLGAVPVELVTCSGSGLDPEISPAAAAYQVGRIAAATGRSEEEVQRIIDEYTTGRFLGLFGEERVNVLKVNLALDGVL